jgi:hypothetical protein
MSEKERARFLLKTDAAIFTYFFGFGFFLVVDAGSIFRQISMRFSTALLTSSFFVTPRKLYLQIKSSSFTPCHLFHNQVIR